MKYRTTKKHPLHSKYKKIELKDQILVEYDDNCWNTEEGNISQWLEKGWIKEIKEKTYPKLDEINSELPTELCNAMLALDRLLVARNAWWEVDGWEPDWRNSKTKFRIVNIGGDAEISMSRHVSTPLSFKSEKIAKDFLETFKKDIETAKELL